MKYLRHDLHGILPIDKPLGPTSMQIVRVVRRAAGRCKTGHAGTLDPLATGLLLVCLGKATKAVPHLMALTKQYTAHINLAALSETDDAQGPVTPFNVLLAPTEDQVRAALDTLTGTIQQTPPAHSAIKVEGRRAYDLARKGKPPELKPRPVRIDRIDLLDYNFPHLAIHVTCGKGTYIRSLARQIAEALGTGGYLTALRRTAIGPYTLDQALNPDQLPQPLEQHHLLPIPPIQSAPPHSSSG